MERRRKPTTAEPPPSQPSDQRNGWGWLAVEVVWLLLIFFLFAGSPPPDAGESHYLVKAKHYWNPAWCPGDLFLDSQDAHLTYYWTFGWLTRWLSLEACAWIGRGVTWGLLAWSWRRLSFAMIPRPLWSLLSAGLMLLLARNFNWARELAVGGFEAKTIAYAFVFLALAAVVQNRWGAALLWTGAAGAFHVLVGGWTAIALAIAWLLCPQSRPVAALLPAAIVALLLALPGLAPTLSLMQGVEPDVSREAARIYVFDRLSHHLVFHSFGTWYILRHLLLLGCFALLVWRMRDELRLRRLAAVLCGAALIALAGIAIDQAFVARAHWLGQTREEYQRAAAPLLRLYWFRLDDAMLPCGVALAASLGIFRVLSARPRLGNWLLVGAILAAGANLADVCYWRAQVRVPGSVIQQRPTADSRPRWWLDEPRPISRMFQPLPGSDHLLTAEEWLVHWQDACRWIAENTSPDAKFLTPRRQQTFKWYAGRAEVATWKDIPQDAPSIVAWKQALNDLYPRSAHHWQEGLAAFTDRELIDLARKYDCQYVVIDRTRSSRRIALPRVYPPFQEENPAFEVFRVPLLLGSPEAASREGL
ncbi:MAG: DUF6798 domain-containing protein [Pirellulaceae bacterium]